MQPSNTTIRARSRRHSLAARLGACAALAVTAALGARYAWPSSTTQQPDGRSAEREETRDPFRQQLAQRFNYRLQVGKVYTYRLNHETNVRRGGAGYADVQGEATLKVHVLGAQQDALDLLVEVKDDRVA